MEVKGFRKGCANGQCIHVNINAAMTPEEAEAVVRAIERAVAYARGKNVRRWWKA